MDDLIQIEIDKIDNFFMLYKSLLTKKNINTPNFIYHLKNINHYRELLEEQIDELNSYIVSNKDLPVNKEQIERSNNFNSQKDIYNKLYINYIKLQLKI